LFGGREHAPPHFFHFKKSSFALQLPELFHVLAA
jgi:hypothetical protein